MRNVETRRRARRRIALTERKLRDRSLRQITKLGMEFAQDKALAPSLELPEGKLILASSSEIEVVAETKDKPSYI